MRHVPILICALLLGACATYEGTFEGDKVKMSVSTDGPTFSAEGVNMVGAIKRNGAVVASNSEPITGTIVWKKGAGWTVTKDAP